MKHRDLVQELTKLGWWQVSSGHGPHEKWTNGVISRAVPRHKEINEFTAKGILKDARRNPPVSGGSKK